MKSIQVANAFILRHGSDIDITNLVLNKLVYFAQVEFLRETGKPLFEDKIEAWSYGLVERPVCRGQRVRHPVGTARECGHLLRHGAHGLLRCPWQRRRLHPRHRPSRP